MIEARLKSILFFLIFILAGFSSFAQVSNAYNVEGALHYGVVWRHSPKLTTRTGEWLSGQELGFHIQTSGRRDWHQWQRYPTLGINAYHFSLGEGNHGDAFGLLPHLSVSIVRTGWFKADFRLGSGLAWVTKPYDSFTNAGQNAVGSHWNNITQFRLGAEARLNAHLRLQTGFALTHFSNGGLALPNYGINLPSGFAGLAWSPGAVREAEFVPARTSKRSGRRFGGQLQTGLAIIEYSIVDGPKYPVWQGSAAGMFHINQVNRFLLGLDYEYNKAVRDWGLHIGEFASDAQARQGATRLGFFLADEFVFGDLGIQLQRGWYLGDQFNRYVLRKAYSKLAMRYYFPRFRPSSVQLFAGITLKAHASVAEYIALHSGLVF